MNDDSIDQHEETNIPVQEESVVCAESSVSDSIDLVGALDIGEHQRHLLAQHLQFNHVPQHHPRYPGVIYSLHPSCLLPSDNFISLRNFNCIYADDESENAHSDLPIELQGSYSSSFVDEFRLGTHSLAQQNDQGDVQHSVDEQYGDPDQTFHKSRFQEEQNRLEISTEHNLTQPEIPTEHNLIPPVQPEIPTEHNLIPPVQPEISTEHNLIPPVQPEIPTEHNLIPPVQPEIPTERKLIPPVQPEIPTEHNLIPPVQPEIPTEHNLTPPVQPEIPTEPEQDPPVQPEIPTEPEQDPPVPHEITTEPEQEEQTELDSTSGYVTSPRTAEGLQNAPLEESLVDQFQTLQKDTLPASQDDSESIPVDNQLLRDPAQQQPAGLLARQLSTEARPQPSEQTSASD